MLLCISHLATTATDNSFSMAATSKTPLSQPEASADGPSMASPNSYQAAHAVLNTNELLCDIVVRLSMIDIVVTTGVCKTWRKALKESVAIRQVMFLAPVDISDICSEMDCLSMEVEDIPRDQYTIVGELHSYVPERWNKTIFGSESWRSISKRPFDIWADMFVTQPPSKTFILTLRLQNDDTGEISFKKLDFTCETGVKVGELHDFCRSEFRRMFDRAVSSAVRPNGFVQEAHADNHQGGRWEVRDGKVCRQSQLRLADPPDPDSSSDESGDSDGEHEDEYDTDEMEEERNEARYAQAYNHDYRGDYDDGNDEWDYGDDDDEES